MFNIDGVSAWYSPEIEAYNANENWGFIYFLVQTHFAWSHHIYNLQSSTPSQDVSLPCLYANECHSHSLTCMSNVECTNCIFPSLIFVYFLQVWKLFHVLERLLQAASLINFLVFLQQGRYQFIYERILGIRAWFSKPQSIRQVCFLYLTCINSSK